MKTLQDWLKKGTQVVLTFAIGIAFCFSIQLQAVAGLPPGNAVTDARALLRLALPIQNEPIRQIQSNIEDIGTQIRARRWNAINSDVAKANTVLSRKRDAIIASVAEKNQSKAEALVDAVATGLQELKPIAEAKDGENLIIRKNQLLDTIGDLEAAMVGEFPYEVSAEYRNLPQLKGRAAIEIETNKGKVTLVADGYNAPVTAGNFVDLVQRGFYNGLPFTRAEEFYVLQTGDPEGQETGFIDSTTGKPRTIPMEIMVQGDKKPTYGTTLEDAGRYMEKPVLPFSAYGTVAMAPPGDNPNGASSQFFFLLFDGELTPAGANLLDGRYAVFGYVIDGQEVLGEIRPGDKVISAKVTTGTENFVKPQKA
jgi:peptidylprolyl isomerase